MSERGKLIASCGHEVLELTDLVNVRLATEDCDAVNGFYRTVSYAVYCPACGKEAKESAEWLEDQKAIDAWIAGA